MKINKKIKKKNEKKSNLSGFSETESIEETQMDIKMTKNKNIKDILNNTLAEVTIPKVIFVIEIDKAKHLKIEFSFFDGFKKLYRITVKKHTTMDEFLELARKKICVDYPDFTEIRGNLVFMMVIGDLMISNEETFATIEEKSQKLGIDSFLEITRSDEADLWENKNVKIIERRHYELSKHLFPFSHWSKLS